MYYALDADGAVRGVNESRDATWDIDRRRIGLDRVGNYEVSTVFLTMDHGYGSGPPVVFETMVFEIQDDASGLGYERFCERYSTKAAAEAGHAKVVAALTAGQKPDDIEVAS